MEEGEDDGELPVVYASRGNVKGVDVECEEGHQVGEQRDRHCSTSKRRKPNKMDDTRQSGSESRNAFYRKLVNRQFELERVLTSPVIYNPDE